ncbi:MAG: cytochrome P450 [Verrucomicrobiota bacterium]
MPCPFHPPSPDPISTEKGSLFWRVKFFVRIWRSTLSGFLQKHYQGNLSVTNVFGKKVFLLKAPELIGHALVKEPDAYPKDSGFAQGVSPLMGDNLITNPGGEDWRRMRDMVNQAFEPAKLKHSFQKMMEGCDALVERLSRTDQNEEVSVDAEMSHATADIIFRTLLSIPLDSDEAGKIFDNLQKFQRTTIRNMTLGAYRIPGWIAIFNWLVWRRSGREVRRLISPIVEARYQSRRERGDHPVNDMLDALIDARDENGGGMSVSEIVNQITLLFVAGHETSASGLTWALYLIANQPEVQDRILAESVSILEGRELKFTDIASHRFTRDVFRETLRLYPPVPILPLRRAKKDDYLCQTEIPSESMVVISPWLAQRKEDVWNQPGVFDPGRWGKASPVTASYLPFSLGPRNCIGAGFAMQEAVLILIRIVREFRLEVPDDFEPEPTARITLRSANGMRLRLIKR